jgi:hypothetical protein
MASIINAATSGGLISTGDTSGQLQLQTGGTTALTVDSSQNVGIGVTPSAWGSFKAIQLGGSTYNAIGSTNSYIGVFANTYFDGTNFKYVSTAGASTYTQNGGAHYFASASSGTAGNNITFTQTLSVGKGSTLVLEGATSVSGTGVSFPATQNASSNANTLDDYEKGTWTPTFFTAANGGGTNLGNGTGYYVKIGNIVTLNFYRTPAGAVCLSLTGMPFASQNDRFSGVTADGSFLANDGNTIINYRGSGEPQYSRGTVTYIAA